MVITTVAMMGPLLVDLADAMTVSVPVAAQLVTTAAAAWALTALLVGSFSDAYGRIPILLLGTCCAAADSLGFGLSPSFALATCFSILVGLEYCSF
jgi:predicted MFS family arabinose efflux permease